MFWAGFGAGITFMGVIASLGAVVLMLRFSNRLARERMKSWAACTLLSDHREVEKHAYS